MMWRGCCWLILCVLPLLVNAEEVAASVLEEEAAEASLQAFEGRWVGHFTVHSTASGYTETFAVEQQYWWKDGTLHGVAVTQRDGGMSSARSETVVKNGKYFSEVRSGETVENFWGVMHEGGILWLSTNLKRTQDYQMKESLLTVDGERVLQTEGFDTYAYADGIAHLVYRGELKLAEVE